jgi:L-ascorbate metabolism protein UlaG (beta-lactamase superfamily)
MYSLLLSDSKKLPFFSSSTLKVRENPFGVSLRYLGTAGFVLQSQNRTAVIDPYLTRPNLLTTLTQKLRPNEELLEREIPNADDVIIGHAHHDHILDAPSICNRTGARFIGSPSACNFARAAGVQRPQIIETKGRKWIECGHNKIKGLPSKHGRVYFNRVPSPGKIEHIPMWPNYFWNFKHGQVLNWFLEWEGLRIMHIDSADFINEELQGHTCDILCLCAIGRTYRPNYVRDAVSILKPKYVMPCHWDLFFTPFEGPHYCLPQVDIIGMIGEIEATEAEPVLLDIGHQISM